MLSKIRRSYGLATMANHFEGQEWFTALQSAPQRFALGDYREAESVVFDHAGDHVYVTTEKRNAPLLRLQLQEKQVQVDE